MANALIRMEGIRKVFEGEEILTHALDGIHMTIDYGEYVAIEGPSGCGKSTLLSILGLLDTPTGGILAERPAGREPVGRRARAHAQPRIGFIFQSFNLIGDLSVYENVELPLTYMGMPRAERRQRVDQALERVGMGHRAQPPARPAFGRPAAARRRGPRAVTQPSILLADEPTGNLDSHNGELVMQLLRELHRDGTTICMVTHDPRYAAHAARAIHLYDGRIVQEHLATTGPADAAMALRTCLGRASQQRLHDRPAPSPPRPRVLVADDQPDVVEAVRLLLKLEGYDVDGVGFAGCGPGGGRRCASTTWR